MINNKLLLAAIAILTLMSPSFAAQKCEQADPSLSGKYELTGVMETGSVILLDADGRFGYMLTVGAYEEIARGCWRRKDKSIVLNPTEIRANSGEPSFKQLNLELDEKGELTRFHEGKRYGVYVRIKN